MSTVLITGGGRGIGFELTRQLAQLPRSRISTIFVTTRAPLTNELSELMKSFTDRIIHIYCEVTAEASVQQAVIEVETKLEDRGLDILINNVGMMPITQAGMRGISAEQLLSTFETNVVSAQLMTASLIPALQRGREKKIIMMSTASGSITYANRYSWTPTPEYKITKAAMNMLSVQYALEFGKEGFTVLAISPGWLKTDMGSENADLDVEKGVCAVKSLILSSDKHHNGKFHNIHVPGWEHASGVNQYDGSEIPW